MHACAQAHRFRNGYNIWSFALANASWAEMSRKIKSFAARIPTSNPQIYKNDDTNSRGGKHSIAPMVHAATSPRPQPICDFYVENRNHISADACEKKQLFNLIKCIEHYECAKTNNNNNESDERVMFTRQMQYKILRFCK